MTTINSADLDRLRQTVLRVWDAIGPDMLDCGDIDNESAIEGCLDADHALLYVSRDANDHIKAMCAEHGFSNVTQALAAKMALV